MQDQDLNTAYERKRALSDALMVQAGVMSMRHAHPDAKNFDGTEKIIQGLADCCLYIAKRTNKQGFTTPAATGYSTSDFEEVLSSVFSVIVKRAREANLDHEKIVVERKVRDFKEHHGCVQDGDFDLDRVGENGEITMSVSTDFSRGVRGGLHTYGGIINLSRESVINDEIEVISDLFAGAGRACARLDASLVYGVLENNPVLADGSSMFHADFGNLLSGTLSAATVSLSMGALRTMKAVGSIEADLTARHLVVPAGLEFIGKSIVHQSGLDLTVTASAFVSSAFYLLADPEISPVIGLLRLSGVDPVRVGGGRSKDSYAGHSYSVLYDTGVMPLGRVGAVRVNIV